VLNLCLGFALAIYLGSGLAGIQAFWSLMFGNRVGLMPRMATHEPNANPNSAAGAIMPNSPNSQEVQKTPAGRKPDDDAAAEAAEFVLPEHWDLDEKYAETSILRLNIAMMNSASRANQIDTKLRSCQGRSDPNVIEACVQLLGEDCAAYLAEQTEAAEKFRSRIGEFGALSALGEKIEMDNLEQSAQVETTINNLHYMDFHTDPEAANSRLIEEIKNLCLARHKLRDHQEAAFLTVARQQNRLDKIDQRLFLDPLTKIYNRIGLETALFDCWARKQQHHNMIAALFDINAFGAVNHKFGLATGDRILCQVAQFLQASAGNDDLLGRYAGQQFLMVFLDVNSSVVLKNVDLWRQTIEKTIFLCENEPVRIALSGAVALVAPTDSYYQVLERLDQILEQVKQTGPNRIFFHNGKEAAGLESHDLGFPETQVAI
jgi:diguanylate cyclase (GGDEF)-like protein